jgi:hypothetical protein
MNLNQCPNCHSVNLVDGKIADRSVFLPKAYFMWGGYTIKAFVCLDCALLSYYLNSDDIQNIRKKLNL